MMNVYFTFGTSEYLESIKKAHSKEELVLFQTEDNALLVHETKGNSIFNEPKKYQVIYSSGQFELGGFAVLNNIPVNDEGRPVFEYRFKNSPGLVEHEPGFVAKRVLRPLSSDTYVIMTLWEKEQHFLNWQQSKSYVQAHNKPGTYEGMDQQKTIFPRPSYVTKYFIPKLKE